MSGLESKRVKQGLFITIPKHLEFSTNNTDVMKINTELREQIFDIVKTQIDANDPAEAKITFDRLIASGYSEFEAKQLIGQCVAVEIFSVLKEQKPFDETRYVKNLKQLPKEPFS